MSKLHLPADGTGGLDRRVVQKAWPATVVAGSSLVMRVTTAINHSGTFTQQIWQTPTQDWLLDSIILRLTTDWTRSTGGITLVVAAVINGISFCTATMATADFTANTYPKATKQSVWGMKAAERGGFADAPATPLTYEVGAAGAVSFGGLSALALNLTCTPSNGTDTMVGSIETILLGHMIG